jgi:hypothetical protein
MPVLVVLLIVFAAILLLLTALVVMRRVDGARRLPAWTGTVREAHDKIRAGQAVDVVVEYSTRYDLGSRAPETILILLLGMTNAGHLHKTAHLMGPARAILAEHALCEYSTTRELCHALRLALAEVEMADGQFIPAAQALVEFAEDSVYPDQVLALAALGYYLGGEKQSVQALLGRIRPYELRPVDKPATRPSRCFQVIIIYLRHRLLAEDNLDRLRELADTQLDPWMEWVENAAPTVYGSHLQELLDDLGTRTFRTASWHRKTVERLKRGEADAVIGEALAEDRTLANLLILAMAHVYRGEGDAAEPYALAAREEAQRRGVCESEARHSIIYCELAAVALADVRLAQGRFSESGEILASRVDNAIRPNAMRAFAAWPFFLADDYERVRTLLNKLDRVSQWDRLTEIPPKYLFMVLYMGHVVLGVDTHTQMEKLAAEQLPSWEDEASRNTGNPYGARLAAIPDDLKRYVQSP